MWCMDKITVDLRMINASGIGTYIRNVLPRLLQHLPNSQFCFLGRGRVLAEFDWTRAADIIESNSPIYSVREQLELPRKIPVDTTLVWSPHYNIPLAYKGKLLVTVHDVFHLAMPHSMKDVHKKLYAKGLFGAVRRKAAAILTDSEFSKNQLLRYTKGRRQKIYPVHLGVDESWFEIRKTQRPHPRPYLLCVGNVKPHKNLSGLLQAFSQIQRDLPHDLVIVGKQEGFITADKALFHQTDALGRRVHFTGYVDDDLLKQYFVHADALVFPSLYEGFGLPPLEAMACGCPVIVSNAASLPEVCSDAALYCNPYDFHDIADKIKQLMADPMLRENLRAKGFERAKHFSWEKCARETLHIIEQVLGKRRHKGVSNG